MKFLPYLLVSFISSCYAKSVVERISAIAVIQPNNALPKSDSTEGNGAVEFLQKARNSFVFITGTIRGLKPGKHGFHIYELGNLENGCESLEGHYNPYNNTHGSVSFFNRHIGDLGNIIAGEDGAAFINIRTKGVPLRGKQSVIGRALVVHENEDDLGLGKGYQSLIDGNSGAKISCGVIGIGSRHFQVEETMFEPFPSQKITAKALVYHGDSLNYQRYQGFGTKNLGVITFEQERAGTNVTIHGTITGLKPGKYGFDIYTLGNIEYGCSYVGTPYNPKDRLHGGQWNVERQYMGDLGNLVADNNGVANIELQDSVIKLTGPSSIVGRTIVITTEKDDTGLFNIKHKNTSVNRKIIHPYACGVIGIASQHYPPEQIESAAKQIPSDVSTSGVPDFQSVESHWLNLKAKESTTVATSTTESTSTNSEVATKVTHDANATVTKTRESVKTTPANSRTITDKTLTTTTSEVVTTIYEASTTTTEVSNTTSEVSTTTSETLTSMQIETATRIVTSTKGSKVAQTARSRTADTTMKSAINTTQPTLIRSMKRKALPTTHTNAELHDEPQIPIDPIETANIRAPIAVNIKDISETIAPVNYAPAATLLSSPASRDLITETTTKVPTNFPHYFIVNGTKYYPISLAIAETMKSLKELSEEQSEGAKQHKVKSIMNDIIQMMIEKPKNASSEKDASPESGEQERSFLGKLNHLIQELNETTLRIKSASSAHVSIASATKIAEAKTTTKFASKAKTATTFSPTAKTATTFSLTAKTTTTFPPKAKTATTFSPKRIGKADVTLPTNQFVTPATAYNHFPHYFINNGKKYYPIALAIEEEIKPSYLNNLTKKKQIVGIESIPMNSEIKEISATTTETPTILTFPLGQNVKSSVEILGKLDRILDHLTTETTPKIRTTTSPAISETSIPSESEQRSLLILEKLSNILQKLTERDVVPKTTEPTVKTTLLPRATSSITAPHTTTTSTTPTTSNPTKTSSILTTNPTVTNDLTLLSAAKWDVKDDSSAPKAKHTTTFPPTRLNFAFGKSAATPTVNKSVTPATALHHSPHYFINNGKKYYPISLAIEEEITSSKNNLTMEKQIFKIVSALMNSETEGITATTTEMPKNTITFPLGQNVKSSVQIVGKLDSISDQLTTKTTPKIKTTTSPAIFTTNISSKSEQKSFLIIEKLDTILQKLTEQDLVPEPTEPKVKVSLFPNTAPSIIVPRNTTILTTTTSSPTTTLNSAISSTITNSHSRSDRMVTPHFTPTAAAAKWDAKDDSSDSRVLLPTFTKASSFFIRNLRDILRKMLLEKQLSPQTELLKHFSSSDKASNVEKPTEITINHPRRLHQPSRMPPELSWLSRFLPNTKMNVHTSRRNKPTSAVNGHTRRSFQPNRHQTVNFNNRRIVTSTEGKFAENSKSISTLRTNPALRTNPRPTFRIPGTQREQFGQTSRSNIIKKSNVQLNSRRSLGFGQIQNSTEIVDVEKSKRPTCGRLKFQKTCATGLRSQRVSRWYFDELEEQCMPYTWGYCRGEHKIRNRLSLSSLGECNAVCGSS